MTDLTTLLVERLSDGRFAKIDHLARDLDADRRDVEAAIQEARLGGHPIIGSLFGVRLASRSAEVFAYVDERESRLRSVYAGTKALREAAERMKEREDAEADLTLGLTA